MTKLEKLAAQIMKEAAADGEPVTEAEALEMAKMEIAASEVKEKVTSADKPKRKTAPRKPDEEKIEIIKKIYDFLLTNGEESATIVNEQREITFRDFSITLTKHRTNKKGEKK